MSEKLKENFGERGQKESSREKQKPTEDSGDSQKKDIINDAVDALVSSLIKIERDPSNKASWTSHVRNEWQPALLRALNAPENSVQREGEGVVDPLSRIVFLANRVLTPEFYESADSETLKEIELRRKAAKSAQKVMFSRYPDQIASRGYDVKNLSEDDITNAFQDIADDFIGVDDFEDEGELVRRFVNKFLPRSASPVKLEELDGIIQHISDKLGDRSREDVTASFTGMADRYTPYNEDAAQKRKQDASKVFPLLKGLLQLRDIEVKKILGKDMSPDEIIQLREKKEALREGLGNKKQEAIPELLPAQVQRFLNLESPLKSLYVNDVKTEQNFSPERLVQLREAISPEIKKALLKRALELIDTKIESGRISAQRYPGSVINASAMTSIFGHFSHEPVQVLPFIAATGFYPGENAFAKMNPREYLIKTFGYDLGQDKDRASDLRKYTNMLD